jgi:proteasomal ATPase-associated factor 1
VSSDGMSGLLASVDGKLRLFDAQKLAARRQFIGHIGDVLLARWFPSQRVAVSGGSDCRLMIWDALSGIGDARAATMLAGHCGGVVDVDFVQRGREIVSASLDGTARLWHIATQQCVLAMGDVDRQRAVNACALAENAALLCAAREDGHVCVYDVRSGQVSASSAASSAANTVVVDSAHTFVIGCQNGAVVRYDRRNMSESTHRVVPYGDVAITRLRLANQGASEGEEGVAASSSSSSSSTNGIWLSTADGVTSLFNFSDDNDQVSIPLSLSGPNLDPINDMDVHGNQIWTVSRDHYIRRYQL